MTLRLTLLSAALAAATVQHTGCPAENGEPAAHADCAGKRCGDPCNPCGPDRTCPTFAPTACDAEGRCATATPSLCYDPCAGKRCGETCQVCPPARADCVETAVMKACNASGACVPLSPGVACPAP
jgi:hypothetical protein